MFKNSIINGCILFSGDLDDYFTQLSVDDSVSNQFDNTFKVTLRVLTKDRIPLGKTLHLTTELPSGKESTFDYEICTAKVMQPKLSASGFLEKHPGWEENVAIREFVKEFFEMYILQNEEKTQVVVFLPQNHSLECFHLVQAFFPKYLPSLFTDKPLTKTELEYLTSLTKTVSSFYFQTFLKIESLFDFTDYMKALIMQKIFRKMKEQKVNKANKEWEDAKRTMEDCFNRYKAACSVLSDKAELLEAANLQKEDSQELTDYLSARKDVTLTQNKMNSFSIAVCTTIDLFDSDIYKRMKENISAYVLPRIPASKLKKESFIRFADHCFSEEADCKIWVQGAYEIDMNGYANPVSCRNMTWENKCAGFNQHLEQYHCSGNYGPMVNDFCKQGDYIGAIEQITASVKSINFAEVTATIVPFFVQTYKDNRPCIELPNGERMTMAEAIAYFDKEEEHETNQD